MKTDKSVWASLRGQTQRRTVRSIDEMLVCCGSSVNATAEPDCFRTTKNSSSRSECCWSDPHLLLLDEPAAGMTGRGDRVHRRAFRTLAGKHSLMVVEHDMGVC